MELLQSRGRSRLVIGVTALLTAAAGTMTVQALNPQSAAAADCLGMAAPIYHRVNPTSEANLLTRYKSEADNAASRYGFTVDKGTPFRASSAAGTGLVAVHRLFNSRSSDFIWLQPGNELNNAVSRYGYVDQGRNFYASPRSTSCAVPVYRFLKGNKHRYAVTSADRNALIAAGWRAEGISFYGGPSGSTPTTPPTTQPPTTQPPTSDNTFTFVSIPDTQHEVKDPAKAPRFTQRLQWLVDNRRSLNLKYVWQVGDLVDWDDSTHSHYVRADAGIDVLDAAGVPYSLTIGNHDTNAVCPGGGACPGADTKAEVRNTRTFNSFFPTSRLRPTGTYEAGKVDSAYRTFTVGGVNFLVLNLELWARPGAVEWAKQVVASHPKHNVIITTHSYLNSDGSIMQSNGGYGSTSPQYVFDNLVKQYANIKFVFSGHVGQSARRTDTGVHGNKIHSIVDCYHSGTTNPMRLLTFDIAAGTVKSKVYAPFTNQTGIGAAYDFSGITWVR